MTRVVALGPADFLCGLSKGGILRIRPGLAQPCLLAEGSSMPGIGFIKKVGVRSCVEIAGGMYPRQGDNGRRQMIVHGGLYYVCVCVLSFSKRVFQKWECSCTNDSFFLTVLVLLMPCDREETGPARRVGVVVDVDLADNVGRRACAVV